jgi:hypothetical protein
MFGNAFDRPHTVIGVLDFHPHVHGFMSHGGILARTSGRGQEKSRGKKSLLPSMGGFSTMFSR